MKKLLVIILVCLFPLRGEGGAKTDRKEIPTSVIIPQPAKIKFHEGYFQLSDSTIIDYDIFHPQRKQLFLILKRLQKKIPLRIFNKNDTLKTGSNRIYFRFIPRLLVGEEGYVIEIVPESITVKAQGLTGFFYAVQSLIQMMPPERYEKKLWEDKRWRIPAATIIDKPRFKWRGMHLDVSRHFFPIEFIIKYIDMLAMHKFNVFHWHLTDDQGWRIEINKYPKLTEVGAWRVDRESQHWNFRDPPKDGERATYGGFYTQKDIKNIIKYAAERNITIVPEIEMPAHTTAALAAYPQFSCTGGPFKVPSGDVWPITDIYCAGNDSTFLFLQDILSEVTDLFPGKYIHIGGDEADKKEWRTCPKCQKRIKDEGLKDEFELQSYFIKRMEKFIVSKGRRLIGWDEILEGGLAPEATVMSWRGEAGGIAAARQNHDVVMTPGSHCYFDYYQGPQESEPLAIGGYTPLSRVYAYEPVPESLTAEQAKHILGAQANVWTEYIPTPEHAQYMTLPRMAAMAEVLWSSKESRNWDDFSRRLENQFQRYEAAGYNYSKSAYLVSISPTADTMTKRISISLSNEMSGGEIRYTLDGTKPIVRSEFYKEPFTVNQTAVICAGTFDGDELLCKTTERKINFHKGVFRKISLTYPYEKYGNELTLRDGLRGSTSFNDGNWQGFHQNDFVAVIDLGETKSISNITTSFLQNTMSWIFFPTSVEFAVATDSIQFQSVGTTEIPIALQNEERSIKEVKQEFPSAEVRFIRVSAKNVGICPEWHTGKGEKAWLFVDEIIVE